MLDVKVILDRRNGKTSDKPEDNGNISQSLVEAIEQLQNTAHTHNSLTNMQILSIYNQSKGRNMP